MRNYKLIDDVEYRYNKTKKQYDTVNNRLCTLQNELQSLKTMYVSAYKEKLQELKSCKTDYIKINKEYTDVKRLYDDPCLGCTMEACLPVDEDGNCPAFRGYINHAALERMYDND